MAQTCFLANAGVAPAMPKTIEIRPEQAPRAPDKGRLLTRRALATPIHLNGWCISSEGAPIRVAPLRVDVRESVVVGRH